MPAQRLGYVRGLDGLRGVAIVGVLQYHLGLYGSMLGWTGVQLFFVISGFLITRILLAARDDAHPFRSFYIRRALRIFPIYYLFLLIVVAWHLGTGASDRLQSLPFYLTYTQNMPAVSLGGGLFAAMHTWSLAIEEQFYWLWPLAVLLLRPARLKYLIPALIIAAPMWRYLVIATGASQQLATGALPSQMDSILVGAALAVALYFGLSHAALRRVGWSAVAIGGAGVVALAANIGLESFWDFRDWTGAHLGFVFLSAVAILFGGVVALVVTGVAADALEREPIVWAGRRSYGLYLYHGLVFFLVDRASEGFLSPLVGSALGRLVLMVLKLGLSFAVAAFSWRFIEKPILRLKDRLAPTTQRLGQANRPNLVDHSASAESGRTSRETDHRPSYATMPPVSSASVRDAANANPMTADWQCIGPEDS